MSTKNESLATNEVTRQLVIVITRMKQIYISVYLFILFYFILFYFILFYFILFYFILFYFIYFILFYFILELNNTCSHVLFRGHAIVRTPNLYRIVSILLTLIEEVLYINKWKSGVALSYTRYTHSVLLFYFKIPTMSASIYAQRDSSAQIYKG